MYTDTEGVILKQTKTAGNRRMVTLFSEKYGKIGAGTGISERGRSRSALAMRPFTHGRYELYKNRDVYHINGAEVIRSFYRLGEDVDKYMAASYALEFTERILPENVRMPDLFRLLLEFMSMTEARSKKYGTLLAAFQVKALGLTGVAPELLACVRCSSGEQLCSLHIGEGGVVCADCKNNLRGAGKESLIYDLDFDILEVLRYFSGSPLKAFEKLALEEEKLQRIRFLLKRYIEFHLDISALKSEDFIPE